jgi:AcrR family transcriptional regulator
LDALAGRGYANLTIEQVAAAAGVAKTAIYRRWSSKAEMVFTIAIHAATITPPADTGSLAGDLRALAVRVVELLSTPVARSALPGILGDMTANPEQAARFHAAFSASQRDVIAAIVQRALDRGELTNLPDIDAIHAVVLGTAFAALHLLPQPCPRDLAAHITDAAIGLIAQTHEGCQR